MSHWLAIDHGTKRLGLAVGDTTSQVATPVKVLKATPADAALEEILCLARQYHSDGIVVGWPINMDDSEGPQAKAARSLAKELADISELEVRLWDERLSSFQADSYMAGKLTRKKRRARQDAVAAAVILEDFLTHDGPNSAPTPDGKPED